jgi:tetratricopeptide (TPR) repeat protein
VNGATALSESPLWSLQREWYEARASEAFAEVPHQVLDNPFVAAAYARVVLGYLRDCARGELDMDEPLYIVELGAGAGRFAHGFVRELGALLDALPLELPPVVYVMTDFSESTLADWAANPLLADAQIDFASFDVTADSTLQLRRRGVVLDRLANPLVVIANYIFDSVPADAFAISGERLEECLLSVDGEEIEAMDLAFERRPAQLPHYGDAELDDLVEHYMEQLDDSVVTIPRAAIDCLRRLARLSGGRMMLLTADKAYTTEAGLSGRPEPEISRHGSFSLMVNLHAFGWWARRRGGDMLDGGDRHTTVAVVALMIGGDGAYPETRQAYEDAIERFGPDDLMTLSEGLERAADQMSAAELVGVVRLTLWDSFTLMGMADTLVEKIADADEPTREDLRDALYEVYERHYPVPGEGDVPFTLGLILYELEDYGEALACFEASLERFGPDAATEHNIALCREQVG